MGKSHTEESVKYIPSDDKEWFVLRATYGREDKAQEILAEYGTFSYVPRRHVQKYDNGILEDTIKNLIPNIIFVYASAEEVDGYVNRTPILSSFLSYYYDHFDSVAGKNPPLTIPRIKMENFIRATASMNEHVMMIEPSQCHYRGDEIVKVTEGIFKDVEGRRARVAGQTRVVFNMPGLGLVSTAYVPTGCMEVISKGGAV